MRREIAAFPRIDDDTGVITWKCKFEAIYKAQQIKFMLDEDYDPDVILKFKVAQTHL